MLTFHSAGVKLVWARGKIRVLREEKNIYIVASNQSDDASIHI